MNSCRVMVFVSRTARHQGGQYSGLIPLAASWRSLWPHVVTFEGFWLENVRVIVQAVMDESLTTAPILLPLAHGGVKLKRRRPSDHSPVIFQRR